MKQSKLFGKVAKDFPAGENSANAKFLIRGGFVDKVMAGVYTYLPLGLRVLNKINAIIRDEMAKINGQEILMSAMQPKENWEKTGRWNRLDVLYKLNTTASGEVALGPTHEEIVTPLVKKYASSYKDFPVALYQIQDKFRNEPRAKFGLLRGREFWMKDLYSFHTDENDLNNYYEASKTAYFNIFRRCGLDSLIVEASGGSFCRYSHEFQVETANGEDTVMTCEKCQTYQNKEVAVGEPLPIDGNTSDWPKMELVNAEREITVAASVSLMKLKGPHQVLKNIIYKADNDFIGVSIRGDLEVNEIKLREFLEAKEIYQATEEELKKLKLTLGFISPVDNSRVKFVADNSVKTQNNYVTGGNKKFKDYINVNLGRDFQIEKFGDLAVIDRAGFKCLTCGSELKVLTTIEVGNIFRLMTKFSQAFDLKYADQDGVLRDVIMGCYGIGPSRVLGSVVEIHHDEKGIIWPESVAPFKAHLLTLTGKGKDNNDIIAKSEKLYNELVKSGVEVLWDDREDMSAGEKFAEADIIGIPYRLVISAKSGELVEMKKRGETESKLLTVKETINELK